MKKRRLEVVVLSDLHLGSPSCRAPELLTYLSSIAPKKLILNGAIMATSEPWNKHLPTPHLNVLKKIATLATQGTQVCFLTGKDEKSLKEFRRFYNESFSVSNRLTLVLNRKRTLFFHGDILVTPAPFTHLLFNYSFTGIDKLLKLSTLKAAFFGTIRGNDKSISSATGQPTLCNTKMTHVLEEKAAKMAIANNYDQIVCGSGHCPSKRIIETKRGTCLYLNAGNWTTHMSALEYSLKRWKIYRYENDKLISFYADEELKAMDLKTIFHKMNFKRENKTSA